MQFAIIVGSGLFKEDARVIIADYPNWQEVPDTLNGKTVQAVYQTEEKN